MRSFVTKLQNLPLTMFVMGSIAVLDAAENAALAGDAAENIGGAASTMNDQIANVGTLTLGGMFLAGVGFVGMGLFHLKKASESNGQVPYSQGLWRLGVGAGLVAVPAVSGILTSSLGLGTVAPNGSGAAF